MPFNTYRSGTMQAGLAADPHRQTLFNAFASWMDGIINDEEIARHVNKEKDPSIRVALFAIRDQLRNSLDSTYATQCVNRIADRRAQGVVRQLYAYGLDLLSPAMEAIRRNGGTALYVPDDYGLVLGPELAGLDSPWVEYGTGVALVGGQMTFSASPTSAFAKRGDVLLQPGKRYRLEYTIASISSGTLGLLLGGGNGINKSAPGTYVESHVATSADGPYLWTATGPLTAVVSKVSVREILSATTFIDSTGTQPVTAVGDLVGLLTDRSYGAGNLGAELVTNGGPFVATTDWSPFNGAALSVASGSLRVTNGNYGGATFVTTATVGKTYRVRIVRAGGSATGYQGTLLGVVTNLNAGETSVVVTATSNQTTFFINSGVAGETLDISSYSVREVLGNHATQGTTAAKPLLTLLPNGTKALDFDGSNDLLTLSSGAILQQGSDHFVTAAFVLDTTASEQCIYAACEAGQTRRVAQLAYTPSGIRGLWMDNAGTIVQALGPTLAVDVPYVVTIAKVGSAYSIWTNGTLSTSAAGTLGTTTVSQANVGAFIASQFFLNGKLIDIVIDQGTLTEADRRTIERNMAQRAGVTYAG